MKKFYQSILFGVGRVGIVFGILIIPWYAFLWLIKRQFISESSALVMVWASTTILLLAAFPTVLRSIKKFKISDFEVELESVVKKAIDETPLKIQVDEQLNFDTKGAAPQLAQLLRRVTTERNKPIILDVDIGTKMEKSIIMLHTYMALLELISNKVLVIFRSGVELFGTIEGAHLVQILRRDFPALWGFFQSPPPKNTKNWLHDAISGRLGPDQLAQIYYASELEFNKLTMEHFNNSIRKELHPAWVQRVEGNISLAEVEKWIGKHTVNWLLVLENTSVVGVINLCRIAREAVYVSSKN